MLAWADDTRAAEERLLLELERGDAFACIDLTALHPDAERILHLSALWNRARSAASPARGASPARTRPWMVWAVQGGGHVEPEYSVTVTVPANELGAATLLALGAEVWRFACQPSASRPTA